MKAVALCHMYDCVIDVSKMLLLHLFLSFFRLLTCGSNGEAFELDRFLRQCLRSYEHVHSMLLKEMVALLKDIPLVSISNHDLLCF